MKKTILNFTILVLILNSNVFAASNVPGADILKMSCDHGALKKYQGKFGYDTVYVISDKNIASYLSEKLFSNSDRQENLVVHPVTFGTLNDGIYLKVGTITQADAHGYTSRTSNSDTGVDYYLFPNDQGFKIQLIKPEGSVEEYYPCGEMGCYRYAYRPASELANWYFSNCQYFN